MILHLQSTRDPWKELSYPDNLVLASIFDGAETLLNARNVQKRHCPQAQHTYLGRSLRIP